MEGLGFRIQSCEDLGLRAQGLRFGVRVVFYGFCRICTRALMVLGLYMV